MSKKKNPGVATVFMVTPQSLCYFLLLLVLHTELHLMIDALWRASYTTDEDCVDALISLVRLQEVYRLDSKSVARGSLGPFGQMAPALDSLDCRHLALVAMRKGLYQLALDWIKQATKLTPKSNGKQRKELKLLRKLAKAGIKVIILW